MSLTLNVTITCDAANQHSTCPRRYTITTSDPAKALQTAQKAGWHTGVHHYCPGHKLTGGRL